MRMASILSSISYWFNYNTKAIALNDKIFLLESFPHKQSFEAYFDYVKQFVDKVEPGLND